MVNNSTTDIGKVAVQFGKSREEPKEVFVEEGKEGHPSNGGTYWIDGVSPQGGSQDGGAWQTVSSNFWTPKLFLMEDEPPGLELQNSFAALGETDSQQERPLASFG